MNAIRINGIRVGHQMFHLRQFLAGADASEPMFKTLAREKVNLPCLSLARTDAGTALSCCYEGELPRDAGLPGPAAAAMISVYPHGSKSETLGYLIRLFGSEGIDFFFMVSSNAMISFMVDGADQKKVLSLLEKTFDLPPTHTPYEPGFHEETAAFVKKRYQETKAYFQEKRIKTYGFALETGLSLTTVVCTSQGVAEAGRILETLDAKFLFSAAICLGSTETRVFCLTPEGQGAGPAQTGQDMLVTRARADLVTFHGPHFGDRFGIFSAAALCLDMAGLDLLLAGCTGASVTLVLPEGQGEKALPALAKGFETP